jgi:tRNA/rRNA methyltransferase
MNLGQAVAVCLYELASRAFPSESVGVAEKPQDSTPAAPSGNLDLLGGLVEETMIAAGYSPAAMRAANRHDLRLLLRRLAPTERETRRMLGLFRRILWRLKRVPNRD